jgi:ATP-binding cassette subfamily B protein
MKKQTRSMLWWILKLQFKASPFYIAWTVFHSIYTGFASIAQSFIGATLIATVTRVALGQTDAQNAYVWLAAGVGLEIFAVIIRLIDHQISWRFQQKADIIVSEAFMLKLYQLSQEQFENQEFNTKVARASDSVNRTWQILSEFSWIISSLITFVSAMAVLFIASPLIGVVIAATVIPMAALGRKQNQYSEKSYKEAEPFDRISYRSRWLLLDPNIMPEIRIMNAYKQIAATWKKNAIKSQNIEYKYKLRSLKFDAITSITPPLVSLGATVYFLGKLIGKNLALEQFLFLRNIIEQSTNSAATLANSIDRLHEISINLNALGEVQNTPPAITDGTVKVTRPITIEFQNVGFTYPGSTEPVLQNVSFLIAPSSKLALVGENGAGKSTLIKLMLRQYLPTEGQILVNGIDIHDIEQSSYFASISNLSQDFLIVHHLTIQDNLTLGVPKKPNDAAIKEALELVGANSFVNKLPHKLLQRLDSSFDDGTGLSGGQIQRLGVARSLLRGGDILILDEPTSAIDAKAEYSIFNNIYRAHAGKTTLIVSHRFSTVRKADKIIVLQGGSITEYGTHAELIDYGGLYKEMFEAQAEGYK